MFYTSVSGKLFPIIDVMTCPTRVKNIMLQEISRFHTMELSIEQDHQ